MLNFDPTGHLLKENLAVLDGFGDLSLEIRDLNYAWANHLARLRGEVNQDDPIKKKKKGNGCTRKVTITDILVDD